MNMNANAKKQKKKLNAIDWFLILAVLLCLAGAAFRLAVGRDGGSLSTAVTMEDYVVSFKISNIRNSSSEYLQQGTEFYMDETDQYFGSILGNVSVTPARFFLEDASGNFVEAYAPENGDATRVDVTGTMQVSGYMADGGFLLGGTSTLAINKTVLLRSSHLSVTITITDIVKAS